MYVLIEAFFSFLSYAVILFICVGKKSRVYRIHVRMHGNTIITYLILLDATLSLFSQIEFFHFLLFNESNTHKRSPI